MYLFSCINSSYVDSSINCVGAINSTSSVTLHSQCGIITTQYHFPIPPRSGCGGIVILVTPMNGAGLGISNSISFTQILISKF